MVRHLRRLALWAAPTAFIAVLFFWPLTSIAAASLSPGWLEALARPEFQGAIWFTIWQALVSTLLCLAIGLPIAFVLYRRKFFGSQLLQTILVIPFVLPAVVVAIALTDFRQLLAGSTILVILIAHVFLNIALVVRVVGPAWTSIDHETDEAAELDGANGIKKFFFVTTAQLRPALVSSAALVFLFCATSFATVLGLGGGQVNSIETAIYFALTQRLDLQTAAALALVQTLITVAAFALSRKFSDSAFIVELTSEETNSKPIGRRDIPILLFSLFAIFTLFVIPIASLFVKAFMRAGEFSLKAFADLAGYGARNILDITVFEAAANSLRNAVVAASIAVVFGVLIAWLLTQTKSRWPDLIFALPLGISGVVLGFGYLITFGGEPLALRQSWVVVPLVQALITMPLVVRITYSALATLGKTTREAASNAGAGTWQIWRFIETPNIRPAIATALGFALLSSIGEFGSSVLLAYSDQATLPVVLMRLISRPGEQNYSMAMATSVLIVLLVVALVAASELARSRRRRSPVA